jgi:hypothetical protein
MELFASDVAHVPPSVKSEASVPVVEQAMLDNPEPLVLER